MKALSLVAAFCNVASMGSGYKCQEATLRSFKKTFGLNPSVVNILNKKFFCNVEDNSYLAPDLWSTSSKVEKVSSCGDHCMPKFRPDILLRSHNLRN